MSHLLLDALKAKFPQNSRSSLQKWLKLGRVYVDGQCVRSALTLISDNQSLEIREKKPKRFPFDVLFEDQDLIVVNKPAGLLSVASLDEREKNLHALLKKDLKPHKIYPVHRLDREVAGPIVFAKSERAYHKLKEDFFHKRPLRHYLALVHGKVEPSKGSWESNLVEDASYRVHVSQKEGKWAKTHYEVLKASDKASLLKLTLETGRKNQLRVHTAFEGHPIIGDTKYGQEKVGQEPLALIAYKLSFTHPISKERLDFEVGKTIAFNKTMKAFDLNA